jgi:carboxyl-terminal processing protease
MDFQFNKKYALPLVLLGFMAFGVGGFYIGEQVGVETVFCKVCKPEQIDFSLFWEAWETLKNDYVDPSKFNEQKMIYGAISGMVDSVGDPHTVFFTPDENKKFNEEVQGSFEGVGMEVGIKDKQLQVVSPIDGTPAQKAGLKAGDKIVKIGETDTQGLTTDEAVMLIKGPRGTEVVLTIFRDGWDAVKEFKIIREKIVIPSTKLEFKDKVAYLKLFQFSGTIESDFERDANKILSSSADRIVLDLRNNPGGLLEASRIIAGWFVEKEKIVVTEDYGSKGEPTILKTSGNGKLAKYPIVILINEGSASASEILAAAIKQNRENVTLVGTKSYGKGTVQTMEPLSDKSSLKITIAKWLTPNGGTIDGAGIEPDIKVEMSDNDVKDNKDPQLDKALEIIGRQ